MIKETGISLNDKLRKRYDQDCQKLLHDLYILVMSPESQEATEIITRWKVLFNLGDNI